MHSGNSLISLSDKDSLRPPLLAVAPVVGTGDSKGGTRDRTAQVGHAMTELMLFDAYPVL